MSYEIEHKKGMCDRCEKKLAVWKVPFLYKDMNDKAHPDLGDGYRQYYMCDDCKKKEEEKLKFQGKDDWNLRWEKIKK